MAVVAGIVTAGPSALHAQRGDVRDSIARERAVRDEQLTAREIVDGYVALALERNLSLAQRATAATRARESVRESRGRFLPTAAIDARYSEFSGVVNIGDFINPAYDALNRLIGEPRFPTDVSATLPFRQETKLAFTQPVYNPTLFAAHAITRNTAAVRDAERRAARRQVVTEVQLAWIGVATTTRLVDTFDAATRVVEEQVRVAERLVSAGQTTPDAVLRARAERSALAQQRADAIRRRDAARRAFNLLLDRDAETPVDLAHDESLHAPASRDADALQETALRNREELEQLQGALRLARGQQRLARSGYLPAISLGASYGVQGSRYRFDRSSDVAVASLVLSWNLFNGGQDASRLRQAHLLEDETRLRTRELERAIRTQVADALDGLAVAEFAAQAARDELASAQRAFELVQRRYAEGLSTPVEFIGARAAWTQASINQVISSYALAARHVELERAAALRPIPE